MRNLFRSVALALTAVTLLGGCISARPYTLLKYDRQTDTFHELRIYTDIAGADNLSQNFRQRDRYIPTVWCWYARGPEVARRGSDGDGEVMCEFAIKRLGNHNYCMMAPDAGPKWEDPAFDHISIAPGKLFLSPQKRLCYYHRVAIPGKVIDELLSDANHNLCDALVGMVERELNRRRAGGRRESWDNLQREMVDFVTLWPKRAGPNTTGPGEKVTDSLTCLEDSSLKLLLASAKAQKPMYSRKWGELQFALALTPDDCRRA